jgi:hypothetical protein
MTWYSKQPPANSLEARLDAKHVDAAREYLQRCLDDKPFEIGRVTQALILLVMDLDQAGHV